MKITRVEVWRETFRLEDPYALAYGSFEQVTNVFVRLDTDRGFSGYGCGAPDPEVTGETPETVFLALTDRVKPILQGADPGRIAATLEPLRELLQRQPTALAAADMALHDILGKVAGLPLWELLGGFRDRIKTSVTIGILDEAETVECARDWVRRGFVSLKLKGGLDVAADIARVLKVREAVDEGIELRFDANQGYGVEEAIRFARQTGGAGVAFLEQPTPKANPDLLGQVSRAVDLPVMADESVLGPEDALCLARDRLADMVNVKLMKAGGISGVLQTLAVTRAAGLPAMVGCMDESALGIAAGLHVALADPGVACADLDGHLGLMGDPAAGRLEFKDGFLYPPRKPGLGIDL